MRKALRLYMGVWCRWSRKGRRRGWRARSQALFGQGGGHLVGQRGELWGVGHVDAAGGGHGAELPGRVLQRDDLSAVVSACLGRLAEVQLVALNRSPQSLQEGSSGWVWLVLKGQSEVTEGG